MRHKPTLFIGSSAASLRIVDNFVTALSDQVSCVPWNQVGTFNQEGTTTNFEAVRAAAFQFDFALFLVTQDDILYMNADESSTRKHCARDNILFEIGLFLGAIGQERVFLAMRQTDCDMRIPSDLLGVTMPRFDFDESHREQSLASINATALGFKTAIARKGYLEFDIHLADGWGRERDPDRFEVALSGTRLREQKHLIRDRQLAIAVRLKDKYTNFEDDEGVVFSAAKSLPDTLEDMFFKVEVSIFEHSPVAGKDRFQARVLLVPNGLNLEQFKSLREAKASGCRVAESVGSSAKFPND